MFAVCLVDAQRGQAERGGVRGTGVGLARATTSGTMPAPLCAGFCAEDPCGRAPLVAVFAQVNGRVRPTRSFSEDYDGALVEFRVPAPAGSWPTSTSGRTPGSSARSSRTCRPCRRAGRRPRPTSGVSGTGEVPQTNIGLG